MSAAWYVTLVAVCCTCLPLSNAGSALAEGVDFRDDFTGLDPARWSMGDHMLPNAPSSISGFFLYKVPDLESEVDIEVFNDPTRRVMFTTYSGGRQTHTETMRPPLRLHDRLSRVPLRLLAERRGLLRGRP